MTTTLVLAFAGAVAGGAIGFLLENSIGGLLAGMINNKEPAPIRTAFVGAIGGAIIGGLVGSIVDYGTSSDVTDNKPALENCMSIAQEKGSAVLEITKENKVICSAPRLN